MNTSTVCESGKTENLEIGALKTQRFDAEAVKSVLDHLLFYKAIIKEGEERKIDHYMELVNSLNSGTFLSIQNQFERALVAVFELVLEHTLDPWNIDLVEFAKMYHEKIQQSTDIDFITAGRIILMAWSVLHIQSETLRLKAEPPVPTTQELEYMPDELYSTPEEMDYTNIVLTSEEPPIQPLALHPSSRQVTLMELVNAFDEARVEAEKRLHLEELRKANVEKFQKAPIIKVHEESIERDINELWPRIAQMREKCTFRALLNGTKERNVIVGMFIALLHLAKMNRIRIWQDKIPEGEIYIEVLNN
ncbi:MAG: segregation/condensation protein A [Thermoplasmata archaeon]